MKQLETWENRSFEEAALFNPAFISSLFFEFVKNYQKEKSSGTPITLLPIFLSVVLFAKSRKRLPKSSITSLYDWIQKNEDLLIGFPDRTANLVPIYQESLRFSLLSKTLLLGEKHLILPGVNKANFTALFLQGTTREMKEIIDKTKFLSRWFAKSGAETSILAGWGVRP